MKRTTELWRPAPGYPELLVSSWGRVLRLPHEGDMPNGGKRIYSTKALRGTWERQGGIGRYHLEYRGRTLKIARLVCEAWHGPPPPGKPYCLHRDENARNNRQSNLYWGTQKENLNAPGFLTYCRDRKGDRSPRTIHAARLGAQVPP